jgi:hypothetical protein
VFARLLKSILWVECTSSVAKLHYSDLKETGCCLADSIESNECFATVSANTSVNLARVLLVKRNLVVLDDPSQTELAMEPQRYNEVAAAFRKFWRQK